MGATYSILPYYWTSETSVVFENLFLPIQESTTEGRNFFTIGPGRFQGYGNGLDCSAQISGGENFHLYFGNYRGRTVPDPMYYRLDYTQTNDIEGTLEIGNAYMSLNGVTLVTGTTYTGEKITMSNPFYLFDSFHWEHNYIRGGRVGKIKFYENGVLTATYTPYIDDNNLVGFLDENNNTMIYSSGYAWVAGPPAKSIAITTLKKTLKPAGETIRVNVYCENSWTIEGQTFLTVSPTAGTGNTLVNVTAPPYTGATARTDTLTFTDTVTGDEVELTLKQKKYTSGQPVYLGGAEVTELYLGGSSVSEAYLGDVLVFSTGTPTPTEP